MGEKKEEEKVEKKVEKKEEEKVEKKGSDWEKSVKVSGWQKICTKWGFHCTRYQKRARFQ
jgi:hypothetical protein